MSYGDILSNGDTVGGLTFIYDFEEVEMMVTDDDEGTFPATSSTNYLGTDDGDMFQDGDDFSLSFSATNAIGMFFITADTLYADDISLEAGGRSVGLSRWDYDSSEKLYFADDGTDICEGHFFSGLYHHHPGHLLCLGQSAKQTISAH